MTAAAGTEYDAYASDEMSVRDYWALARRRKWYIIVPVLFAVGFSLASSLSTTPMYRAVSDVLVEPAPVPGAVQTETAMNQTSLNNEVLTAQGPTMQEAARAKVGDEPTLSVALAQDRAADLLVFTAESRSARRAADAANAYAETFVAKRQADLVDAFESQMKVEQDNLDAAEEVLAGLDSESLAAEEQRRAMTETRMTISDLRTAAKLAEQSGASIVNVAEVPASPFAPRPARSAAFAVLFGLFVGLAAAFLRDFTDNHIRTPEGLEKATGRPTSSVIPRLKGWKKSETHVVMLEAPTSPQAEAYRSLRARIQFRRVDRQIHSLMITSARPGEGKTTTSANLAVAFATAGENTVLVDLDMRRPRIHKFFPMSNDHGMSTVLLGGDLSSAIQPSPVVPNLSILPAGPSTIDSSEILHDDVLDEIFGELKQRFDVVVVDTPPVLAVADPLTVAHHCDGTLLVVSASGTDKRDAELASNQLKDVGAPVIGAVLNNYSASATGYSYSYAYSDYSSSPSKGSSVASAQSNLSTSASKPEAASQPSPGLSRRERRRMAKQNESIESLQVEAAAPRNDELAEVETSQAKVPQSIEAISFAAPNVEGDELRRDLVDSVADSDATGEIRSSARSAPAGPKIELEPEHQYFEQSDAREDWGSSDQPLAPESAALQRLESFDVEANSENSDSRFAGESAREDEDADAEVMSAAEFRHFLRAELRRAREEHVTGSSRDSDAGVQTIKVVLVAGEENELVSDKSAPNSSSSFGKRAVKKSPDS